MPNAEKIKKPMGRPPRSPSGKKQLVHIALSPDAREALRFLCDRDVAPIPASAMIEHLILHARDLLQAERSGPET